MLLVLLPEAISSHDIISFNLPQEVYSFIVELMCSVSPITKLADYSDNRY